MSIIRATELDVSAIKFSDVKNLDNGGRLVNVSYGNDKGMLLQFPEMIATYGLSSWAADKPGAYDKLHLDLSLAGYDTPGTPTHAFFEKISAVDKLLLNTAITNSKSWLKKTTANHDIASALYTPLIKFSKDKDTGEISTKYPPVIRLSIPRNKKGEIDVEVYDKRRNKLDFETVNFTRAKVTAIVAIQTVWLISGKFGMTLKVQQMKVEQNTNTLSKYAFIADSDEEADE